MSRLILTSNVCENKGNRRLKINFHTHVLRLHTQVTDQITAVDSATSLLIRKCGFLSA